MKNLIIFLFFMGLGCQGLVFSQDYTQTEKALKAKYSMAYYNDFNGGWFSVKQNDKQGACDLSGKEIVPCKYDNVVLYTDYYGVTLNDKQGACDLSGKEIVPCKYDNVVLYTGYYGVTLNNKKGACDLSGKEIIPCKYDNVMLYTGYYGVTLNNKEGACDLSGKEIVPCNYHDLIYSDGFKYKDAGEAWALIENAPRLAEHDRPVASTNSSLSETSTATATTPKSATTATVNATLEPKAEDMSFFINNHYVKQSNDYTKMHLISFTDKNIFKYMIFDGRTGDTLNEHDGTFQYNSGKVVVTLTDNTILRFSIVKLTTLSIGILFEGSPLTPYAKWFSTEDLFSLNSAVYWRNVGSGFSTNNSNINTNTNTPTGQQPKRVCAYCNGTGKRCVLKTVPTYGARSYVEKRCQYCGQELVDGVVHVLQTCTMCGGTGYR